jgi:putative endonuclease
MKKTALQATGESGEQVAFSYLVGKGLRPLLRNYRCKGGELDLIMLDGSTLALIEVRVRKNDRFGGAAASITPAKQRRITVAGKHLLLTRRDLAKYPARFDVVAIEGDASSPREITWIKDAFRQ